MQFLIILIVVLILPIQVSVVKNLFGKIVKNKSKTDAKPIDDKFIQEIVNSISNGHVPRFVLANTCEKYNLKETQLAALSGKSIASSVERDLVDNSLAKGFGALWDVCENNGAALSPTLNQFGIQIRTENELREELSSALASSKLSAYVLAGLPLFGIGLASFLGINSLNWLFASKLGFYVLIVAIFLEITGIIWVRALTSRIEKSL